MAQAEIQLPSTVNSELRWNFPLEPADYNHLFTLSRDPSKYSKCVQIIEVMIRSTNLEETSKSLNEIRDGERYRSQKHRLQLSIIGVLFESSNYPLLKFLCEKFGAENIFNTYIAREDKLDQHGQFFHDLMTPTHMAVSTENQVLLEHLLLDPRANPNIPTSEFHWSPLTNLSQLGSLPALCSLFIRPDLNLGIKNCQEVTSLHVAAIRDRVVDSVLLLPLMMNLSYGHNRPTSNFEIDAANSDGNTALHETITRKDELSEWEARMLMLLSYGANPEKIENRGDPIISSFNEEIGRGVRAIVDEAFYHLMRVTSDVQLFRNRYESTQIEKDELQRKHDKLREDHNDLKEDYESLSRKHECLKEMWIRNEILPRPRPEHKSQSILCRETGQYVPVRESVAYTEAESDGFSFPNNQVEPHVVENLVIQVPNNLLIHEFFLKSVKAQEDLSAANLQKTIAEYITKSDARETISVKTCGEEYRIPSMIGQKQVVAKCDIARGSVIGQYIGSRYIESEYDTMYSHDPNLRQLANEYCFEIGNSSKHGLLVIDVLDRDKRNLQRVENALIFVNDCRMDITDESECPKDRVAQNAIFVMAKVNQRPELFLIALRLIQEGQEVLTHYGDTYPQLAASKKRLKEEENKRRMFFEEVQAVEVGEVVERVSVRNRDSRKRKRDEPEVVRSAKKCRR